MLDGRLVQPPRHRSFADSLHGLDHFPRASFDMRHQTRQAADVSTAARRQPAPAVTIPCPSSLPVVLLALPFRRMFHSGEDFACLVADRLNAVRAETRQLDATSSRAPLAATDPEGGTGDEQTTGESTPDSANGRSGHGGQPVQKEDFTPCGSVFSRRSCDAGEWLRSSITGAASGTKGEIHAEVSRCTVTEW